MRFLCREAIPLYGILAVPMRTSTPACMKAPMNRLFAPLDIYCERLDAGFWSEPVNALTNVLHRGRRAVRFRAGAAPGNRPLCGNPVLVGCGHRAGFAALPHDGDRADEMGRHPADRHLHPGAGAVLPAPLRAAELVEGDRLFPDLLRVDLGHHLFPAAMAQRRPPTARRRICRRWLASCFSAWWRWFAAAGQGGTPFPARSSCAWPSSSGRWTRPCAARSRSARIFCGTR